MSAKYDHALIEPKWQQVWEKNHAYRTLKIEESRRGEKKYVLDMFPYPSGAGLHVGHIEGYTGTDVLSRFYRMNGYAVLHPMGWDAFGLPAENYAIKNGIPPEKSTHDNIKTFKGQIKKAGLSYDWNCEIDSSSPEYYRWTQWLFILLFKKGLAYKKLAPANWCPKDETVLANEQVVDGKCERCGSEVVQKDLEQWFFKITDYSDRLIDGLTSIDWPKSTKTMQENWIGKKTGANVKFKIKNAKGKSKEIEVFTTRPDTIFGVTFLSIAPEHELAKELAQENAQLNKYIEQCKTETNLQREHLNKEKTGINTGLFAINPVNGKEVPIFVADYVLSTTGTGAVMGVPAHDERDFAFAQKFGLEIIRVVRKKGGLYRSILMGSSLTNAQLEKMGIKITQEKEDEHHTRYLEIPKNAVDSYLKDVGWSLKPKYWNEVVGETISFVFCVDKGQVIGMNLDLETCGEINRLTKLFAPEVVNDGQSVWSWLSEADFYKDSIIHSDYGILENSGPYNGLSSVEAVEKLTKDFKSEIKKSSTYHLRDWLVSRQRYWGAPIPMNHCDKCGWQPVEEKDLPILLPTDVDFKPTGESPIASSVSFQNGAKCSVCGGKARREVDTMDTFVDSSWYFLRFCDSNNLNEPWSKEKVAPWAPVDVYVGGAEHTVLHLMYARFFYKVFFDLGMVDQKAGDEPFLQLRHQGTVLGPDSRKMSKRWGNVINPDDVVNQFGADTLRIYELFMGPFEGMKPWSVESVAGVSRFLGRVYANFVEAKEKIAKEEKVGKNFEIKINRLVQKVTDDIPNFSFNTSVAAMMGLVNDMSEKETELGKMTYGQAWKKFILVLAPFAPHLAEEMWQEIGAVHSKQVENVHSKDDGSTMNGEPDSTVNDQSFDNFVSVHQQSWPEVDKNLTVDADAQIPIMINSKVRATMTIDSKWNQEQIISKLMDNPNAQKYLSGKEITKFVHVPNRIVNIVTN